MIDRRQFLIIAALGSIPLPPTGMQATAVAGQRTEPGMKEQEFPRGTAEQTQERKPAEEPFDQLIVINPGHYKYSGENLGTYVPGIGHEYVINTQISLALNEKLQAIGLQAIVTRDEQNYIPEITDFIADRRKRLETEFDAYISRSKRRRRELGRRESILQLGIMRYAEGRKAAAMIDVHVDDQPRKRRRRRAEAKGFSVILNKTASSESERLQGELCSALRETSLPFNRCYHIKNARRGIFILGNSELGFSVPSCIVECGFMRQQYVFGGSQKHICDPEVQDLYAASLARGLSHYFGISGA